MTGPGGSWTEGQTPGDRRHMRRLWDQPFHFHFQTDFEAAALGAKELTALVSAWQNGAISRDTLLHNLRTGEILPPARSNEQEVELIGKQVPPVKALEIGEARSAIANARE